ncbi:MAG: two-component system nitrogen regulation sensor histidine kinase NtrY [Oceanicoccus sp.]
MSHEKWLVTGLSLTVIVILSLLLTLAWSIGWSFLAIATLLFVTVYPLVWLAWRCYSFWCQTIKQLTTYTQILKEDEHNFRFKAQHSDNLLLALQNEIDSLATKNLQNESESQSPEHLLSGVLDSWPVPVCLFDHHLKLTYRNTAMNDVLQQPMLLGSSAVKLGFTLQEGNFCHPQFDKKWQRQTISYLHRSPKQKHWFFSAIDVSKLLTQNKSITQQNLVRVLGHELRNSLTPMYSMTDTLLASKQLDEQQTRLVLSRIQKRSQRLLSFVGEYGKLAQLPQPKLAWFDFSEIVEDAKFMSEEADGQIDFQGNSQCFGDVEQLTQVMINLLKNSREACDKPVCKIQIRAFYFQHKQIVELFDNGPGFANLENVLTPFYTTKKQGSGIGLSLCAEIIHNHSGQFKVENVAGLGAKITMEWPL